MSANSDGWRQRLFGALADIGLRRPRGVLAVVVLLMAVAGGLVANLGITSSRTGLVGENDPSWRRLREFYEEFGRPNPGVFVVRGGSPDDRRKVVDALQAELEADELFNGRVLGRVTAPIVAPLALLQRPQALTEMRGAMPPDVELAKLIEGGLPAWLSTVENQIYGGLDGAENPSAGAGAPTAEEADAGLMRLAGLATALDDVLAGRDPLQQFMGEGGARPGLDGKGYTVSGDGELHLVSVFAEMPTDEASELEPIVARMEAARDRALADAPAGVEAIFTGTPKFIVEELEIIQQSTINSSITTTLGITLLCLILFRSVRQAIIALIPLGPGVLITLAAVRVMFSDLNLITSSFVAALLGLGIDFSVHALARFHEERRAGGGAEAAARRAMVQTGPGIATGAVVTAAAFLTTMTTDFTAFGELGLITAIGLVAVALATFTLLPPLLAYASGKAARPSPEFPGLGMLARFLTRMRRPLLAVSAMLAIAGGAGLSSIEWNSRYFDFLPDDTESARGLAALEYDALASPVFANLTADDLDAARAMAAELRELESVAGVQTPSDLIPALDAEAIAALRAGFAGLRTPDFAALAARQTTPAQLATAATGVADALDEASAALASAGRSTESADAAAGAFKALAGHAKTLDPAAAQRLAALEGQAAAILAPAWTTAQRIAQRGHATAHDLPALFATRFAALEGDRVALYVVPSGRLWERDVARAFAKDVYAVDPNASGLALDHVSHGDLVLYGFLRAAAVAAGIIFVLLVLDFGGPRDALLALVPTGVGWLWMLGVMALLRMKFDVANIVCLPLVLGVGVAFGVHFMHRVREDEEASLDTVLRGTGGAIAIAALTTMVAFAGLASGRYGGMQSLGWTMVLGIATSLLATVCVLPAMLLTLRRLK